MGMAEMEWLFHVLLEAADEDLVILARDMPMVLSIFETKKNMPNAGPYFLSRLIQRGDVVTEDLLVSTNTHSRFIFKIIIPENFKK